MRWGLISLFAALALVPAVSVAEPAAETLAEAMGRALETNPSLLSVKAQAEAVKEALPIARADYLPQLSLSTAANHVDRSEPTFSGFVREKPEYWIASVNASWLLFSSGRTSAATRQARAQIANAAADYQQTAQELLLDVSRAYTGVLLARSVKESQTRAQENLEEQLRYVEANVRAGFLTETDRAQARARLEQARASLALADAQLSQAEANYVRFIGHVPPLLTLPPTWADAPATLDEALRRADEYNPTILAAAARLNAAEAALQVADATGRPRLSLEGSGAVFEQFNPGRGSRDESENTVALRFSVPLYAGGGISARSRQQRSLRTSASYGLGDARRAVAEQVSAAWASLRAAEANVAASVQRLEAADLAQRGMRREQSAGTRSVIDVLNQEQELLSARVDLARAERDRVVNAFELAVALGALSQPPADPAALKGSERSETPATSASAAPAASTARAVSAIVPAEDAHVDRVDHVVAAAPPPPVVSPQAPARRNMAQLTRTGPAQIDQVPPHARPRPSTSRTAPATAGVQPSAAPQTVAVAQSAGATPPPAVVPAAVVPAAVAPSVAGAPSPAVAQTTAGAQPAASAAAATRAATPGHRVVRHTAQKNAAVRHTAKRHAAKRHAAKRHVAKRHAGRRAAHAPARPATRR